MDSRVGARDGDPVRGRRDVTLRVNSLAGPLAREQQPHRSHAGDRLDLRGLDLAFHLSYRLRVEVELAKFGSPQPGADRAK